MRTQDWLWVGYFSALLGLGCDTKAPPATKQQTLTAQSSSIKHVFVIAMENHDARQIYGNHEHAPYLNGTLIPKYAHATNFVDLLALHIPSEPHYVMMEAGTNAFSDHTFLTDADPSAENSTSDTAHLVTQIKNANNGVSWRSYQEGLSASTGLCPIHSRGFYAAKHDPFVFFHDVAGNPPSADNAYCIAHHRAYDALAADLKHDDVASFTFITPNLCHDMHGATDCHEGNAILAGDTWLSTEMPRLIDYVNKHAGVIFIVWDEGSSELTMPFVAVGPSVKSGYASTLNLAHGSVIKSIESILQLPMLATVQGDNGLADLFQPGKYP